MIHKRRYRIFLCAICLALSAWPAAAKPQVFHPRTLLGGEYWGTVPKEGYLDYVGAVKADLLHGALLGPELCSSIYGAGKLAGITQVYPPVGTVKEYLTWWRTFNAEAHKRGVKVQATFSLTYVWGDQEQHTGFFKYYNDLDERTLLPIERWGKGENYLWYSSPIPIYLSDLKKGVLGDSALDGRVLRAMAGDNAFELLKYDYFRWRVVTAESLAQGGICFGAWEGGWSGGQDREQPNHLQTYYQFIRDNDRYLNPRQRESYAEVALIYPRQALFAGDATFFGPFRDIGRALLTGHVLFDVIIDQKMTLADLTKHRVVIVFPHQVTEAQRQMLGRYVEAGGKVIVHDAHLVDGSANLEGDVSNRESTARKIAEFAGIPFSTFDAPWTVEVYTDRQPQAKRVLVHFVNFNRDESQAQKELPIAAAPVKVDLRLPAGFKVAGVRFLTPEVKGTQQVKFTQHDDRVQFTTPGYLVYGLVVIQGK